MRRNEHPITERAIRKRKCHHCGEPIKAEQRHIRFQHTTYASSKTENICAFCIEEALNEINQDNPKTSKEMMDDTTKIVDTFAEETTWAILQEVEELLDYHEIVIPDDDREGHPTEANLYGDTYYNLEEKVKAIIKQSVLKQKK